jgi:hypothetical protein
MIPDEGNAGSSVAITDLVGSNFQSGATVQLAHSGSTSINATSVAWVSSSHMTCAFTIPSDSAAGSWDIIITNPDGQSVTYSSYFTVHGSTSSVTTTTTTSASSGAIGITSVTASPNANGMGWTTWTGVLTIATSTTLQQGSGLTVTLTNTVTGATMSVYNPQLNDSRTSIMNAGFTSVPSGTYNVKVTSNDGSTGSLSNGFIVS